MATASAADIPGKIRRQILFPPLVRSIAKEEGISLSELERVNGTGKDGRITKQDILSINFHQTSW